MLGPYCCEFLAAILQTFHIGSHCVTQALAQRTDRFTGADLSNLCQEAALMGLREGMDHATEVKRMHFESALAVAQPSLSVEQIRRSEDFRHYRRR